MRIEFSCPRCGCTHIYYSWDGGKVRCNSETRLKKKKPIWFKPKNYTVNPKIPLE
jgi:hypothetical protein